jgi:hypothetical protein
MKKRIAKYLITKQWFINLVRLSLPDEQELDALRSQYRAGGGDAGWIQEAYKKGYIDGWNKTRNTNHLRKITNTPKKKKKNDEQKTNS